MATYPLINGVRYDFSSIEARIAGQLFLGFKEISYNETLEPGEVRGTSAQLLARTRGEYKAEGSVTLFKQEWAELLALLGNGYLEVVFPIVVHYADTAMPVITDNLVGVRLKGGDNAHSQGTDPLVVKSDLHIMYIKQAGLKPLTNLRE